MIEVVSAEEHTDKNKCVEFAGTPENPGISAHYTLGLKNSQNYISNMTSPVSGFININSLNRLLERGAKQDLQNGEPVYYVNLDIDHFKSVNDNYGHEAGDVSIRKFGETLAENIRETDKVFLRQTTEPIYQPGRYACFRRSASKQALNFSKQCDNRLFCNPCASVRKGYAERRGI